MSTSAARITNRRAAMDREPVHEQRRIRAEEARQFEEARKSLAKRVVLKVGRFFKKAAKAVVHTTKAVAAIPVGLVKAPFVSLYRGELMLLPWQWAVVRACKTAVLFVRKHWAEFLAGLLFAGALVIAPATTFVAAVFIAASYAIARVDSPFARFVAHVFFRAGVETFAEGLAFAVVFRDRR